MKKITFALLLIFTVNSTLFAQKANINFIDEHPNGIIGVECMITEDCWIGLTINPGRSSEINLPAQKLKAFEDQKVRDSEGMVTGATFDISKGLIGTGLKSTVKRGFDLKLGNEIAEGGITNYTVCIWGKKVNAAKCLIENGSLCEYCKKKGFHLENRLTCYDGQYIGEERRIKATWPPTF